MSAESAVAAPLDDVGLDHASDDRRNRLSALFDAHEPRLYRLARRLTSSADQAHDLVQDTFFKAAKSWRSVPAGLASEEAWLVRVLVNIRRDQWRRTAVRNRATGVLRAEPAVYPPSLESTLIAKRAVWAALDLLHPRRRAIVVMHELEGMTYPTIAACLGITTMTVRWHLSMARRELKTVLRTQMGNTLGDTR
jgi:RNA polymerase sigma-70 factor (ECF subfamily)